jgi:hypothetical protein
MARAGHGLHKVSPGPYLSTHCWRATPEMASWSFRGGLLARWAACSHFLPLWKSHAVCLLGGWIYRSGNGVGEGCGMWMMRQEKIRCGGQKKEVVLVRGIKGLHLHQGDITVDVTVINDENDVIHNWRIDLKCYHNTRGRTRSGRHEVSRVSRVSMNTPNS